MKPLPLLLISLTLLLAACASPAANAAPPQSIDTGIDPNAWVKIPAGQFLYGAHSQPEVIDYDYEMMLTDVTNASYAQFLNEAMQAGKVKRIADAAQGQAIVGYYPGDPFHGVKHEKEIKAGDWLYMPLDDPMLRLVENNGQFAARPGYENHPATMVTWFGAKGYCEFYGWRLPTAKEWEKAARGTDGRAYPWGNTVGPENANYYSSHDIFEKIAGALGDTTPAGFYNGSSYDGYNTVNSPSPYGLYDMAGNVWQWAADITQGTHYRFLRGGSKADYAYNLRAWTENSAGPDYFSPNAGFRCVR
jgi:formylglycine-generating enzyme